MTGVQTCALPILTSSKREKRLDEVTQTLCVEMLKLAGMRGAEAKVKRALDSGAAAERFGRMVAPLGGPKDFVEKPKKYLPKAPVIRPARLGKGVVVWMDVAAIGRVVLALGGGRRLPTDSIDHAVGLTDVAGLGSDLSAKQPFCMIHARSESDAAAAEAALKGAVVIGATTPPPRPVIVGRR